MRITRILVTDTGADVTLYLEGPIERAQSSDFYCTIGLEGDGISERASIYGIDEFQALLLSIKHLEHLADQTSASIAPRRLFWELGQEGNQFGLIVK